ncbi:hypothetical protein CWO91_08585 [Bradyrhizobium genosp. SA-3]|uniref:hypothetical protein n=1 Tax=Bradyrhizobium genosp. SA-3 TaxID=508868 RepID=UPI00102888C8|nr:hypothetical protein [Bradyrhizobium genosp. SA-3]RZN11475.1 hypothetical protein CWO91_08585 [Bradyrhizobium genosp. SA-3]
MNRKWILVGSGALLLGLVGVAMVTAEPEGRGAIFIAGDKPVSEDQIRQKLQSDGWSNVQIVRNGWYFEAIGSKDGQTANVAVNSRNGRLRTGDDDDED